MVSFLNVSALSAPGDISTVAGTGTFNQSDGDGGLATATAINLPYGVAVDSDGNIYFSEYFGQKIRKVDAMTGIVTTIVGTGTPGYNGDGLPGNQTEVHRPFHLNFGPDGALYFSDFANSRIRRFDPETGLVSTYAGTGENYPRTPDGAHRTQTNFENVGYFAFAPNGDLVYGEAQSKYIRKADATTGIVSTILGDGTDASTGDGGPASEAQTTGTASMFVGPDGSIYFGEQRHLRKIDGRTNVVSTIVGGGNDRSGEEIEGHLAYVDYVRGIVLDEAGNVFFGEDSARISRFDPRTNLVKRIAGKTNAAGYSGENVPALGNEIGYPSQAAFDREGNLYIAFGSFGRIRKIEGAGESAPINPVTDPKISDTAPKADLLIGINARKMKGKNRYDQRKASRKQTLNLSAGIFRRHNAKMIVRMENDGIGTSSSEFRLQARPTSNPGISTKAFAKKPGGGRRVITGAMKRSGYTCSLKGGESVQITYQMETGRFWAGAKNRSGRRQNWIRFKASSGGTADNCSAVTNFR